jgi:aminoglycoside phosphotransferase (APT) family kinase protein
MESMATMSPLALGSLIGIGKEAEIFEYGTGVLKVYNATAPKRAAFREAALLALVESLGLPVPEVYGVWPIADRWGVAMSRADGPSFAEAMLHQPDQLAAYLNEMALLHLRVHGHRALQFPAAKPRLAADIEKAEILGKARREALLRRLEAMPDADRLCHGDFHPFNVLGPPGQAIIIDWPNAGRGDPAADVCRAYVLIRHVAPDVAGAYVDSYAGVSNSDVGAIFEWLPLIAAARLSEGVQGEEAELIEMVDRGLA